MKDFFTPEQQKQPIDVTAIENALVDFGPPGPWILHKAISSNEKTMVNLPNSTTLWLSYQARL